MMRGDEGWGRHLTIGVSNLFMVYAIFYFTLSVNVNAFDFLHRFGLKMNLSYGKSYSNS